MLDLEAVTNENISLKLQVEELGLCSDDIYDTVYDLGNQLNESSQYYRRENIELQNIPESVEQKDLEIFIVKLFKSFVVKVSSYDLVAVHLLGKPPPRRNRNVIVRFLNRITAYSCLQNAKFLN